MKEAGGHGIAGAHAQYLVGVASSCAGAAVTLRCSAGVLCHVLGLTLTPDRVTKGLAAVSGLWGREGEGEGLGAGLYVCVCAGVYRSVHVCVCACVCVRARVCICVLNS